LHIIQSGFRTEQRHTQIKELFKKYKKLTRKQVVEITKVGPTTITKDLLLLTEAGFIVRRTPTKSARTDYFEFNEGIN
jgi:DeoR/GlpR family transcriptional regulator of sugar metabolism